MPRREQQCYLLVLCVVYTLQTVTNGSVTQDVCSGWKFRVVCVCLCMRTHTHARLCLHMNRRLFKIAVVKALSIAIKFK